MLTDKSAFERVLRDERTAAHFAEIIGTPGTLVAACHLTALEIGYSARSHQDYLAKLAGQKSLVWLPVTEEAMDRALEVQGMLAQHGCHRLPIPDLIIAATAEIQGATVLHVDGDYETIAGITGQPQRRLRIS
ncbi:PIN domain nuclease [Nocardia seriolae]|nr:PIN domain nuclease [Nocardia seriolae]APA94850.1 Ribonuclease VapC51 [Nocardia seriolae]MTJ60143.1 PIN domain-containing protein [Nocardia seriolae]MTJ71806.1 PIN domain-containing protein [Nocardia seriolae]MTJ85139.1 PIN domain-containing protein [Nocardia seriolae]MTK29133.1 PIN domain-containing protein [Nocardia seriolae]